MDKMRNNTICHFRINKSIVQKLDSKIKRLGYTSRTGFFTAIAYFLIYWRDASKYVTDGEILADIEKIPENMKNWMEKTFCQMTEEEIFQALHKMFMEHWFAAIAMNGAELVYENTWGDVREIFHEETGIWLTKSDLREAFLSFDLMHRVELNEYCEMQRKKSRNCYDEDLSE